MKKNNMRAVHLLFVAVVLLSSFILPPEGFYSIRLKNIDDAALDLSNYKGKKVIIFTLSGKEADSSLHQLATFYQRYKDSAVVIGIPSLEDGYNEDSKASVKRIFKEERKLGIVLTGGMYTKRTSAASQSELMQWLTHREQNLTFNEEVRGPGQKFFLDEEGRLYAVMGPEVPFSHPVIQRIMSISK